MRGFVKNIRKSKSSNPKAKRKEKSAQELKDDVNEKLEKKQEDERETPDNGHFDDYPNNYV